MKLRFRCKKIKDLSAKEHCILWSLTFRTRDSLMRCELAKKDKSNAMALMAISPYHNTIVGWACLPPDTLYLFVRPDMRRKGIGSALLKKAKAYTNSNSLRVFKSYNGMRFYKKKLGIDLRHQYSARCIIT